MKLVGGKVVTHMALAVFALGTLSAMVVASARTAHAASGLEYTVDSSTAAGGVYARFGPHSNDTQQIVGYGIYPGETVELLCGITDGDPVGPYQNTVWHFIADLSNPAEGNFWVADHYLDTPYSPGQLVVTGEAQCLNESSNPLAQASQSGDQQLITSVFFSPISDQKNGLSSLPDIAGKNYLRSDWSGAPDCSNENVAQLMQQLPPTIDTLAGWSEGRLGPIYYLVAATTEQKNRVHTIILFDPGNTNDFTNGSCDTNPRYNINAILADWLSSNPMNRLIIYTGLRSEEGNFGPCPQPFVEQLQDGTLHQQPCVVNETFAGLWQYYLAGIWNQPFANQAQICDYNGMSHENVLADFAYTVKNPISSCRVAKNGQQPVAWNP